MITFKTKEKIKTFLSVFSTQTAKDTYLVMVGNAANGATGLVLSVLIARNLSVPDFGTFSSLMNVVIILMAVADLGMMQGVVNFAVKLIEEKKWLKLERYLGTMISFIFLSGLIIIILLQLLPINIVKKITGTGSRLYLFLGGVAVILLSLYPFFLAVFQSFKKFLRRTVIEIVFGGLRIGFLYLLILNGLSVGKSILAYILGALAVFALIWRFWPAKKVVLNFSVENFKKIFKFSRWLWLVNMIINIYGRMDILILTALTSSIIVGQYAAAARLALVFPMIISALNAVISPRFASFSDKQSASKYVGKTFLLAIGTIFVLSLFFFIAKPLVLLIYGSRYLEAIALFKALVIANIPFLLVLPATNCLVYFTKKPGLITAVSFLQLLIMVSVSLFLVPTQKAFAPVYGFITANFLGLILMYYFLYRFHFQTDKNLDYEIKF